MHEIRLLDEALDINKTNSYHLSIQAGPDGFSFVILDPAIYKYLAIKHFSYSQEVPEEKYPGLLEKIFRDDEFLSKEYQSIFCMWQNQRTTLLPSPLFEKEKLKQYFEFNHVLHDLEELHANHLKSLDAYLIFPVHHEIANVFVRQFPMLKLFNQATPFIEYAMTCQESETDSAHVNIHKDFFDIIIIRNRSLILHNTFKFRNERDLIYFTMNVYDKLHLNPDSCPVHLSGMIEKNSGMTETVKRFIATVLFARADSRFKYSHTFERIPEHFFLHLYNLYNCG